MRQTQEPLRQENTTSNSVSYMAVAIDWVFFETGSQKRIKRMPHQVPDNRDSARIEVGKILEDSYCLKESASQYGMYSVNCFGKRERR